MKKLLFLILLSYIVCQKEISKPIFSSTFDSIKCLLRKNILYDSYTQIIEAFKTKNLIKIISTGFSIFQNIKKEYIQCSIKASEKNTSIEDSNDDIKLGYPRAVLVLAAIIGEEAFQWYDNGGYYNLRSKCVQKYGQTVWFCNYFRNL